MINGLIGLRPVCKKGVDGKSLGEWLGVTGAAEYKVLALVRTFQ